MLVCAYCGKGFNGHRPMGQLVNHAKSRHFKTHSKFAKAMEEAVLVV